MMASEIRCLDPVSVHSTENLCLSRPSIGARMLGGENFLLIQMIRRLCDGKMSEIWLSLVRLERSRSCKRRSRSRPTAGLSDCELCLQKAGMLD